MTIAGYVDNAVTPPRFSTTLRRGLVAVIDVDTVQIGLVPRGGKDFFLGDGPGLRALNSAMIGLRADPARIREGQENVVSVLAAGFMNWLRIGGSPSKLDTACLSKAAFDDDQIVLPSRALAELAQGVAAASTATSDDVRPVRQPLDRVVADWDRLIASDDGDIHEQLTNLR